ncbi:ribonuclease III [Candidatus Dojkabacteria bacterium]|uniref:Ribonuclease 3 n=1 Tax=Candidatus Dojkabacteria bacterium TaxID=2099670 RepID=A0A955RJX5_9BACT|nr:ribonuclease III [Candidatus Dojkabacteria bacterium]
MNISPEEKTKLESFAQSIGITYKDISNLKRAFIHRSYLNEVTEGGVHHNERLEFLGDAVLELIITEYLFDKFPERSEGELTSFRAALVKTESLAETAMELKAGDYLYISKGEDLTGGRTKPYILANTYEAILGSIYRDQGYNSAQDFVSRTLIHKIDDIVKYRLDIDSKSRLQELAQEIVGETPSYQLVESEGPDHNRIFTMRVMVGPHDFGSGKGRSKQLAEQQAAEVAIKNWDSLLKKYTLK